MKATTSGGPNTTAFDFAESRSRSARVGIRPHERSGRHFPSCSGGRKAPKQDLEKTLRESGIFTYETLISGSSAKEFSTTEFAEFVSSQIRVSHCADGISGSV